MIRVLAYHTINDVRNFEDQILYLKENYDFISLEQLYQFVYNSTPLPTKPLLVTFDDGDRSVYENALGVLKRHQVPAACFIITSIIGTEIPFWWKEIDHHLGKKEGYKKTWEVKNYNNQDRVIFLEKLRSSTANQAKQRQLSLNELQEMSMNGITICNHSHTHPMFDRCTRTEIEQELIESIQYLKDRDFSFSTFAYPNGNSSKKTESLLKDFNIKLAFLFDHKINKKILNPYQISRLIVNDTTSIPKLKFIMSGWHSKVLPVSKKIGKWLK